MVWQKEKEKGSPWSWWLFGYITQGWMLYNILAVVIIVERDGSPFDSEQRMSHLAMNLSDLLFGSLGLSL